MVRGRCVVTTTPVVVPPQRSPERRRIDLRLTPGQLDEALRLTGWPTWTGRGDNCPIALVDVPESGRERAWELGIEIGDRCLQIQFGRGMFRRFFAELADAIADVAPLVAHEINRLGLTHVVEDTDAGVPIEQAWYLLGVGVEGL